MDPTKFTDPQKQALLDLMYIGMCLDGNPASVEEERIERMLDAFKFPSKSARDKFVSVSISRLKTHGCSPKAINAYVSKIVNSFPTEEIRRQAYDALYDMISCDNEILENERQLLASVKEEFKL